MLPVLRMGICSDLNRTAQLLQMAALKCLEIMSGMILSRLPPKFAANWSQMKCYVWKCWQDELWFSIWRFFEQFVSVNNHLLCYQPSMNWSRRSVLNFKFSVFTFPRSMSCSMSHARNLCEVKIFQLQSMSNTIRCIDQRFAFKNSGTACLALIFNLSYPR